MKDVRGVETHAGDEVVLATRHFNIARFEFAQIVVIDEQSAKFRVRRPDGNISSWMNWYYYERPQQENCKVLRLGP